MKTVAVVGSRDYPSLSAVQEFVMDLPEGTRIVTGDADGVDCMAREAAKAVGLELVVHGITRDDWMAHGKCPRCKSPYWDRPRKRVKPKE